MKTKMKKFYTLSAIAAKTLILAASVSLFTQCSSKSDDPADDNTSGTSKNGIAPPTWIQGYWADINVSGDVTTLIAGARFTKDNLIIYAGSTMEVDLVALAKPDGISLSDEESSTKYTVILQITNVQTTRYQYEKKFDTEIVYTAIANGQPSSSFVLTKQ
jgi:hypothetical protein